jgi:hypothetical protein
MATVYWRNGVAWGYVQVKGKRFRKSLDTKDKRVARDRLAQWVADLKGTRWGERPKRPYEDAANKFIHEHLPRLKGGLDGKAAKRYLVSLVPLSEHFQGVMLDDVALRC